MPESIPEEIQAEEQEVLDAKPEAIEEAKVADEAAVAEEETAKLEAEESEVAQPDLKKNTAQERINEITYKFREAERQTAYWKKLATGDSDAEIFNGPVKPGSKSDNQRPDADSFETVADYEDALFGWYDKKRVVQNRIDGAQATLNRNISAFKRSAAIFKESHPDFDKVLETPVFTDAMRRVLLSIDMGVETAYYIAKNKDVGSSLQGLTPEQQIVKVVDLKHKIVADKTGKLITGAPDPLDPVGNKGNLSKDPDDMNINEWMKWNKERDLEILERKIGE